MYIGKCANPECGKVFASAGWYALDAPRYPASGGMIGAVTREYQRTTPPRFCSEECQSAPHAPRQ